jgi:hypothetical protein
VGGVYRDQGNEVASNWLKSLLRPHVEAAYRSVREDHLLPSYHDLEIRRMSDRQVMVEFGIVPL